MVSNPLDAVDVAPGDGVCASTVGGCTLRAAVMEANALPGYDTIWLSPGTCLLTIPGAGEDGALTGDLDITDDVLIRSADPATGIIDAGSIDNAFDVLGARLELTSVGIQNAAIPGTPGSGSAVVVRSGQCALLSCWISGTAGSGVESQASDVSLDGARFDHVNASVHAVGGSFSAMDCTMTGPQSGFGLDGVASARVVNSTFSGSIGALVLTASSATVDGTTMSDGMSSVMVLDGSTLSLTTCFLHDNQASIARGYHGGALEIENGTVQASGCIFARNSSAGLGGAICVGDGASAPTAFTAWGCELYDNHAAAGGGAIYVDGGDASASPPLHSATLVSTTFLHNTCDASGGAVCAGSGGTGGALLVTNCTFTQNLASDGGALAVGAHPSPTSVRVAQCTLVGNTATDPAAAVGAGGIAAAVPSDVAIRGCIVAGNAWTTTASDLGGPITSQGWNLLGVAPQAALIGDTARNVWTNNPEVGPIGDYGGPVPTMNLLPGSPAIDAGPPAGALDASGLPLTVDERGALRPSDGNGDGIVLPDIGAFEVDCTSDADGDTVGDGCDCAPQDPTVFRAPSEVPILLVARLPGTDALLSWTDLSSQAGSAAVYDVATGVLADLHAGFAAGSCLSRSVTAPQQTDTRLPSDGQAFWYLVRAHDACGTSTFGATQLDASPACD